MDDKDNTGSPDRDRISLSQDHEVQYWTRALGVGVEELQKAVQAVGPTADAVRQYLGRQG